MQASGPPRAMQRRSPGAEPGPPPNIPVRSISPAPAMQPRGSGASGRSSQGSNSRRPNVSFSNTSTTSSITSSITSSTTTSSMHTGIRRKKCRGADQTTPTPSRSHEDADILSFLHMHIPTTFRDLFACVDALTQGRSGPYQASNNPSMPLSQIERSVTHLLVATKQLLETLTQWSRGQATDSQVSDVYVRLGYEFNMASRAFSAINVDTSDLGNVPEMLRHILESTLSQEASPESLEKYLPRIRDIIINLLHGLKRKQQKLRQKQARDRDSGPAGPVPERTTSTGTTSSMNSGITTTLDDLKNDYRDMQQPPPAAKNRFPEREDSRASVNSGVSSMSSNTMQSIPVLPPYPDTGGIPAPASSSAPPVEFDISAFPPPPPPPSPPPKQSSSQRAALAALQKGGELERRASRRYSQFQLARHLGTPAVPLLPSQGLPLPNREKGELKESLRAVQVRETPPRHRRNVSSQSRLTTAETSPVRLPSRVSEEPDAIELPAAIPVTVTPESPADQYSAPSATLRGPLSDSYLAVESPEEEKPPVQELSGPEVPPKPQTPPPGELEGAFQETPSTPSKELTLFLQYKSRVKKFVLPEGISDLTIGRLQLAFIEKFSWNTQQNGVDLPDIYIQDPVSGVRHELEDLSDIRDRTVLVLNVEPLDEVKKHIDDGLRAIKDMVQEVKQNVDNSNTAILRVSDQAQQTAKEVSRLASTPMIMTPPPDGSRPGGGVPSAPSKKLSAGHLTELQNLRRELAVMRQAFSSFQTELQSDMTTIRVRAKASTSKASIPAAEGAESYSYVINGRKELNANSDRLVGRVDDLQDLIEDLRKDVVHRGVRPLPRQLETVNKDIVLLTKELKKMEEYMNREKPIWTKIWEKELEDVCQGRDELRLMEDLMVDLRDDLEKASETFSLVEQATKEQMKDIGTGASASTARNFSRALDTLGGGLGGAGGADPSAVKEGVLGEVRALRPNHENRLEAIERAEKLRQKELESRKGTEMQKELASFVGEGKLKRSGGFEEVERARKAKDDRIRREVWERQNGIIPEDPIGEDVGGEEAGGEEAVGNNATGA